MSDKWKIKIYLHVLPSIVSVIMLVLCMRRWPYVYYVFLRWVVCLSAITVGLMAYCRVDALSEEKGHKPSLYVTWAFVLAFGFVALLFNPIWPVHLTRDEWLRIDLLVVGVFLLGLFGVRYKSSWEDRS